MDVMEAIYQRRSVRNYSDQPVSDETLNKIIAAGMMAPSAGNQQPWHFIAITKGETLKKVGDINPNALMAADAQAAIMVCGDPALEKYPGYWIQDCTAAVQNMLLATHALGLGAVWTGTWPNPQRVVGFRKLLNIPDSVNPLALIVIGNLVPGDADLNVPDRYREDRIHREKW